MVPSGRRGLYLQLDARMEDSPARKGKWSPRGTGMTVLTYHGTAPRLQARLVKTVNIQVRWAAAHPGQDRQLQGVVTHFKAPAGDQRPI